MYNVVDQTMNHLPIPGVIITSFNDVDDNGQFQIWFLCL
jgi:hypothetical protein